MRRRTIGKPLFLMLGALSAALLLLEQQTLKTGLLLCLSIWCFCRFYYFAFYVIERYGNGNGSPISVSGQEGKKISGSQPFFS